MKDIEIDKNDLEEKYGFDGKITSIEEIEKGNINNTFVINIKNNEDSKTIKYLCQRVNTKVFNRPFLLMRNIQNVTTFINNYYKETNDNIHKTLEVIPTLTGSPLYITKNALGDNEFYRVYSYIDNSISYDETKDKNVIYIIGKAFGNFAKALNKYPANLVEETIKDFHNTPLRYQKYIEDLAIDAVGRAKDVEEEINFFKNHEKDCYLITDLIKKKKIPLRVVHNDTKINNVMLNKNGKDYIAVIDLDTVMPGSILYDYGDGIRSSCATRIEDSTDYENVDIDTELFKYYTKGFLEEASSVLKKCEIDNMTTSIKVMTLELAIRFFNDYINGDAYFRTNYDTHNLVRARNQIALFKKIEEKEEYLNDVIHTLVRKRKV